MKNNSFVILTLLILLVLQGCGDFNPIDPVRPACEFDENHQITFYDLQLKYPTGLSYFHQQQIPIDMIERSLINLMYTNGDLCVSSKFKITANLKANGNYCYGEKAFNYYQGAPEISDGSIHILIPSNAPFLGDVTVNVRGDSFHNPVGSGAYYYIKWYGSGNDPNGGVSLNSTGSKITYNDAKSVIIVPPGTCIYEGGQQICSEV